MVSKVEDKNKIVNINNYRNIVLIDLNSVILNISENPFIQLIEKFPKFQNLNFSWLKGILLIYLTIYIK